MVYSSVGDFAMMRRFSKSNKNKEKLKGKKGGEGWPGGVWWLLFVFQE